MLGGFGCGGIDAFCGLEWRLESGSLAIIALAAGINVCRRRTDGLSEVFGGPLQAVRTGGVACAGWAGSRSSARKDAHWRSTISVSWHAG